MKNKQLMLVTCKFFVHFTLRESTGVQAFYFYDKDPRYSKMIRWNDE